jgi:hypothetical protein
LDGISLSASAATAVGLLLTSLSSVIGVLFWQLLGAKDRAILREQELTNKLLPAVEENTRTLQRLVELLQEERAQARLEQAATRRARPERTP